MYPLRRCLSSSSRQNRRRGQRPARKEEPYSPASRGEHRRGSLIPARGESGTACARFERSAQRGGEVHKVQGDRGDTLPARSSLGLCPTQVAQTRELLALRSHRVSPLASGGEQAKPCPGYAI